MAAEAQQSSSTAPAQSLAGEFQVAVAAYRAGNFAEAASQLEQLSRQVPTSFEVHELLGLAYGAQSQTAKAIEQLQRAVELKPDSAAAQSNLATALFHAGQTGEAEARARKALALDPENYDANHNLAESYLRQERIAEALPFLKAAQKSRPEAYDNGYDLALAYLISGEPQQARPLIRALLAKKDTGELHTLLGRVDEKEGKYLEAENEFAAAAHMDPSDDNLFVWASELLLHRTYEPAIVVFREGTRRYPKSPRLWIGLGMSLYSHGEYNESIAALLAAADLNPTDPRCYLFLSKAYLSAPSHADDVIERFRRYATLKPNNGTAQYYYALGLWKGGRLENPDIDYAKVAALLERAISLDPKLADAHLQLGILYTDQRVYDKALPEYQRALELEPTLADAHFRLGRYYLHAGDKVKAQGEFEAFRALQAQHQAQVDKERADVQQFVLSTSNAP